jgi:hypothetical protein
MRSHVRKACRLATIVALGAGLLLFPEAGAAQSNRGRYPNNQGGGLHGLNFEEITRVINDCERRTNSFKRTLDKALARDNVRAGQGREDQLNRNAQRLEDAMDRVGDSWNKDRSYDKTRSNVRAAVGFANDINNAMRTWNMGDNAERDWAAVRAQLNILAAKFNTPQVR